MCACVRAGQFLCICSCLYVCICVSRCCFNRRAFAHIYDGPVVFDDENAYVTNAAGSKYGICCVVFGLWLVLVVFSCCAQQAGMVCVRMCWTVYVHVFMSVCVHMRFSLLFQSACVCAYLRWTRGVRRRNCICNQRCRL